MATMVKPETKERQEAKVYGSLADLQRPRKRVEAEIEGKIYCFQDLSQSEIEDITLSTSKEEVVNGQEVTRKDYRGNQARWIAHSWVNPDGTRVFQNPMAEYVVINNLPRDIVQAMWAVVDKLLGLTPKGRDTLGKESGESQDSTGGSN